MIETLIEQINAIHNQVQQIKEHIHFDKLQMALVEYNNDKIKGILIRKDITNLEIGPLDIVFIGNIFNLLEQQTDIIEKVIGLIEHGTKVVFVENAKEQSPATASSKISWEFFLDNRIITSLDISEEKWLTPQIMLCHSRFDKSRIISLYEHLSQQGYKVWFDKVSSMSNQQWLKTITDSQMMVIGLSTHTADDEGEIKLVLDMIHSHSEYEIPIIIIKLDDCQLPSRLNQYPAVDWFTDNGTDKLNRWLKGIDSEEVDTEASKLWGRVFFGLGENPNEQQILLADKTSGYRLQLPNSDLYLRFEADFIGEKIIRILPDKGMELNYKDKTGQATANQYIDSDTYTIDVVVAGVNPNVITIGFQYLNFLEALYTNVGTAVLPFIGGKVILEKLLDHCINISKTFSFVVSGIHHSGKTALIDYLFDLLGTIKYQDRFRTIRLDYKKWCSNAKPPFANFKSEFQNLIKTIRFGIDTKILFFIDDYDLIFDDYGTSFNSLFAEYQEYHGHLIHYILAGHRSKSFFDVKNLDYKFPVNTLYIPLRGFGGNEQENTDSVVFIDYLLDGAGLLPTSLSLQEKQKIAASASYYPYFIMAILLEYCKAKNVEQGDMSSFALTAEFIQHHKHQVLMSVSHLQLQSQNDDGLSLIKIIEFIDKYGGAVARDTVIDELVIVDNNRDFKIHALNKMIQVLSDMGYLTEGEDGHIYGEPRFLYDQDFYLVGEAKTVELSPPKRLFSTRELLVIAYVACRKRFLHFSWFEQPEKQVFKPCLKELAQHYQCSASVLDVFEHMREQSETLTVPPLWLEWQLMQDVEPFQHVLAGLSDEEL